MMYVNLNSFDHTDYDSVQKAVSFLKTVDLKSTPLGGSHQEGDSFYCQTLEYDTEPITHFDFEVHQQRLDLHYIVEGEERIDVSPDAEFVPVTGYNDNRDIQYVETPKFYNKVILHVGDFILIGMHEPHRTNGEVTTPVHVRKIVLKLGR